MPPYLQNQAAARAQEREYPADWQRPHRPCRLPPDLCHQHRPRFGAARRAPARGPLFPASTRSRSASPLASAARHPLLCDYFLDKFRQRYSKNVKTLAPSVYHLLIRNRWPGNVRELENAVEGAPCWSPRAARSR
jgi:hypothetical protein